jgi:hypothetical protein
VVKIQGLTRKLKEVKKIKEKIKQDEKYKMKKYIFINIWVRYLVCWLTETYSNNLTYNRISKIFKFWYLIQKLYEHFEYLITIFCWRYEICLKEVFSSAFINWPTEYVVEQKYKYLQKGYKYKNLGIYLKDLVSHTNKYKNLSYKNLYYQNLNILDNYCYLLIRLNRKNLFLTLLNNDGNVLCKTNIGASGFKKKVKRTGYAIKGTGKNFVKIIKETLLKNIFILYKKLENINVKKNIKFLKFIENKNIKLINIKRKKINKNKNKINKNLNIIILNKKSKKVIRSKLLWIKIFKNLAKYRIYYSSASLNNLIKKNFRIILRIKTSLKLWAFRFVVYGLFKKLPWFRGIEFRLPITHSTSLRLKKKRRV